MFCNWTRLALVALCSVPLTAQVRPFGASCGNTSANITTSAPAVAGTTFDLVFESLPPSSPFILVFGVSNTQWGAITLPFDMAPFGFPGCPLNVSYNKAFTLFSDGNGRLAVPIQTAGFAPGMRLYSQLLVPLGPGQIAASRGFELTLAAPTAPFSFVGIPDTQNYVIVPSHATVFSQMTEWLVNNRVSRNIVFITHVGDVVNNGATPPNNNQLEWDRAETALKKFDGNLTSNPDGVIPWAATIGNRDFDATHVKGPATKFLSHFGPSRFTGRSWYKGSSPDGHNSHQVFSGGGKDLLHITLEWRADDSAIAYARRVLAANPDLPAIITTHEYLESQGTLPPKFSAWGATPDGSGDNGGADLFHKLFEPYPQVIAVICGHIPAGGHRRSQTILGHTVHEALIDYTWDFFGGNGFVNQFEFRPDTGEFESMCVSGTYTGLGNNRANFAANNRLWSFDLNAHRRILETTRAMHFVHNEDTGHGVYTDGRDTFVSQASPAVGQGTATDVVANGAGLAEEQGLLRFDNVFGPGTGQVPSDKHITQAILTLTTEGVDSNSTSMSHLYQLLVPFQESSTWNSLINGIQVGTESEATPVTSTGAQIGTKGTYSFDVTASLRAWQGGASNNGWVIVNSGSDSWTFRSNDWTAASERPMLTVIYEK